MHTQYVGVKRGTDGVLNYYCTANLNGEFGNRARRLRSGPAPEKKKKKGDLDLHARTQPGLKRESMVMEAGFDPAGPKLVSPAFGISQNAYCTTQTASSCFRRLSATL